MLATSLLVIKPLDPCKNFELVIELKLNWATLQISYASHQTIVNATVYITRMQQADKETNNFKTKSPYL